MVEYLLWKNFSLNTLELFGQWFSYLNWEIFFSFLALLILLGGSLLQQNVGGRSFLRGLTFFLVILGFICFQQITSLYESIFLGEIIENFGVKDIQAFLIFGLLAYLMLIPDKVKRKNFFEYEFVIILSFISFFLLLRAMDLITFYLALELQSFCFYILVGFNRRSLYSLESCFKYFLLGALASGFLSIGISLLYFLSTTTSLVELENFLKLYFYSVESSQDFNWVLISLILIVCGLLFKMGAFPFHLWLPSVYEGAPLASTIFFATLSKVGLLFFIFRLFSGYLIVVSSSWVDLFLVSAICSIGLGSLLALMQKKITGLFAYSTISHTGFIFLGLVACSLEGSSAMLAYMVFYVVSGLLVWGCISILGQVNKVRVSYALSDWIDLATSHVFLGYLLGFSLLSLAGIPPFIGFFSKTWIFTSLIRSEMVMLAVIGVLLSGLSAFYYVRLLKIIVFDTVLVWSCLQSISQEIGSLLAFLFWCIVVLALDFDSLYVFFLSLSHVLLGF